MLSTNPAQVALVTWCNAPTTIEDLKEILAKLSDAELLILVVHMKRTAAGSVAFAEYGRRAGYYEFEFSMVDLKSLSIEASGRPAHQAPKLGLRDE